VLTGSYRVSCNALQETLACGDFNCLTATLLYQCLADQADLTLATMSTPTHVWVRLDATDTDIEPTCPNWFAADETHRRDIRAARISSDRRPSGALAAQPLTTLQLLAKIYYNRACASLERQQFEAAVAALDSSRKLDPHDPTARENLLAALNNWALAECDAGRCEPALRLIRDGRRLAENYAPLAANELHVYQRWAVQLCERKQFAAALQVLESGCARRPDTTFFAAGRAAVYCAWVQALVQAGEPVAAAAVLRDARQRFPDHPQLRRMSENLTGDDS
jgi:tetratricopeptide (TPR) repeat protein